MMSTFDFLAVPGFSNAERAPQPRSNPQISTPSLQESLRSIAYLSTGSTVELGRHLSNHFDWVSDSFCPQPPAQLWRLYDGRSMVKKTVVHRKDSSLEPLDIA